MSGAPSVALVLGAGGVLGGAYHAGALAALAETTGFDARDAALLVGTSAGSITAATLRAGVSPADHLARAVGDPLSPEGRAMLARAGLGRSPGRLDLGLRVRPPADPLLVARALAPFGGLRPGVALAGALPAGTNRTEMISEPLDRVHDVWPEAPTWIVAVRLGDGARVVFGRDGPVTTVGRAAAASSAIPGFFAPVEVGGRRHVDGGAHSPTNADLCAGLGFDLVVVVSPMSGTRSVMRRLTAGPRLLHGRSLAREVAAVRRRGSAVLTIQPGPGDRALLGGNPLDVSRRAEVAATARRTVADRLAAPAAADRLALLRAAAR